MANENKQKCINIKWIKKTPRMVGGYKANPEVEMGGISSDPFGNTHFTTGRRPKPAP